MPANQLYLTKNPWQRFAKLSCGILGGYLLSSLIHMNLFYLFSNKSAFLSVAINSIFLLWVGLIIVPFLFKNGWKAWLIYSSAILLLGLIYFFILR